MKRFVTVALTGLVVAVVLLVVFKSLHPAPPLVQSAATNKAELARNISPFRPAAAPTNGQTSSRSSNNPASPPVAETAANSLAAKAGERVPDTNAAIKLPPEIALQNVRRVVHQYGAMFGGNPVGTNPEITAALTGNNPKQINFLTGQPGMSINGKGELVDAWGTPYFFHQLSGTEMEIHSAGPDKTMWTSDDLVTR